MQIEIEEHNGAITLEAEPASAHRAATFLLEISSEPRPGEFKSASAHLTLPELRELHAALDELLNA